ncbi:MAG: AtpZ/AtpI family protein [Planctomycetota bacterium]
MTSDRRMNQVDRATRAAAYSGFEFAASVAAFAVGGYFLDRWRGTTPLWTIVGASIGFIGGGYNLYKATRRIMRSQRRSGPARGTGQRVETGATPVAEDRQGHSGAVHEHVPAFRKEPRRERNDFGMFGRTEATEEDMLPEEELRWPEGALADDTLRVEDDDDEAGGKRDG